MKTAIPLRDGLAGATPYGAPEISDVIRLNVNENPYPPSPAMQATLLKALATALGDINRYPDREAVALRTALADYLGSGLSYEQIWAADGSNEVMTHLLLAFGGPGRCLATLTPTYSMYPQYARDTMTRFVTIPRRPDFTISLDELQRLWHDEHPDLLLLATPNNPTGTPIEVSQVGEICEMAPWLVIADEAYKEFAANADSATTLLAKHHNLVVVRTMSKAFALAGGRLGYLATDKGIVDACRIVRLPYHLSATTQALALAALANADEPLGRVAELRQTCQETQQFMRSLGLTVPTSETNFALFGLFTDRHAVWQALLDERVLVREVGPDGYLRVSMGTPADMAVFREALLTVLETGGYFHEP